MTTNLTPEQLAKLTADLLETDALTGNNDGGTPDLYSVHMDDVEYLVETVVKFDAPRVAALVAEERADAIRDLFAKCDQIAEEKWKVFVDVTGYQPEDPSEDDYTTCVREAVEQVRETAQEEIRFVADAVNADTIEVYDRTRAELAALRERIEALVAPGSTWPMPVSGREMVAADDVRALLNEGGQS